MAVGSLRDSIHGIYELTFQQQIASGTLIDSSVPSWFPCPCK